MQALEKQKYAQMQQCSAFSTHSHYTVLVVSAKTHVVDSLHHVITSLCEVNAEFRCHATSAVARVSEAPPEISRGAPHTLLAYYYELQ